MVRSAFISFMITDFGVDVKQDFQDEQDMSRIWSRIFKMSKI